MIKKKKVEHCDVIVLGGGDNGLLCASYLQRAGAKTLLVQKQKQWDVVGNLVTEEFQGPYHFNMLPPYMIMMADGAPCYADLNLAAQSVKYLTPDVQVAFHHEDAKALVLHRDPEKSAAAIGRFNGADANRFITMYTEFKDLSENILIPSLYVPDGDQAVAARLDGSGLHKRLGEIASMSPTEIIDSYGFEDPAIREALLYLAVFWGTDPEQPGIGQVVPLWVYRLLNSSIPVAGNLAVGRALYQSFLQAGGEYPALESVVKILVEDGRAVGVRTHRGLEIRAKAVVSTLNVEETYQELVGEDYLSQATADTSANWKWETGSLLTCHYGYKGERPTYRSASYDPDADQAYINIFGIEKAGDVMEVYSRISVGLVPEGHGRAVCLTQFDSKHAGYYHIFGPLQVLRFEIPAPGWLFRSEWEGVRVSYLQTAQETWRRFASNVVDGTLSYGGVMTPSDLEQRLPTFRQGGFKGGMYTVDRIGYRGNRPAAAAYRSDLPGLYMGGASTHPGGLIFFAAGYNAARVVAEDLGIEIWWQEPEFVRSARNSGYL